MSTFDEILEKAPKSLTPDQKETLYAQLAAKKKEDFQKYWNSLWFKLCPSEYDKSLDYAKIPANHAKVRAIVEWKQHPVGMFIIGPTGRAKTRAAWHAIKLRWYPGVSIVHASAFQISQDALKALSAYENGHQVTARYANADILFLDDIGKRYTQSSTQFLFEVIERRTSNGKPIIATSNDDYRTLAEKIDDGSGTMSEPFIRRLEEFCELVVLP